MFIDQNTCMYITVELSEPTPSLYNRETTNPYPSVKELTKKFSVSFDLSVNILR